MLGTDDLSGSVEGDVCIDIAVLLAVVPFYFAFYFNRLCSLNVYSSFPSSPGIAAKRSS